MGRTAPRFASVTAAVGQWRDLDSLRSRIACDPVSRRSRDMINRPFGSTRSTEARMQPVQACRATSVRRTVETRLECGRQRVGLSRLFAHQRPHGDKAPTAGWELCATPRPSMAGDLRERCRSPRSGPSIEASGAASRLAAHGLPVAVSHVEAQRAR